MPNNTVLYLHSLKYDLQARIPAPRRPNKPRRRERERGGGEYVHQKGRAADPVEKVLIPFFFNLNFSCSH